MLQIKVKWCYCFGSMGFLWCAWYRGLGFVEVMVEFFGLRVDLYFREFNALYLKVEVAEPIVEVFLVLILKPAKLVKLLIHPSKQHRHLEATLVQLKLRVY